MELEVEEARSLHYATLTASVLVGRRPVDIKKLQTTNLLSGALVFIISNVQINTAALEYRRETAKLRCCSDIANSCRPNLLCRILVQILVVPGFQLKVLMGAIRISNWWIVHRAVGIQTQGRKR
uniref:Uncharacterized protein n=1 Tax=Opuntia streptacantha TaxID=393608 RepID=A0A7C8ZD15_OPUST